MALKMNTTHKGINVADAYCRVSNVDLTKSMMDVKLEMRATESSEAFSVSEFICPYDIAGDNPIAQAYVHLKTLPEFTGAVDC
jgi:hypothetical protein